MRVEATAIDGLFDGVDNTPVPGALSNDRSEDDYRISFHSASQSGQIRTVLI